MNAKTGLVIVLIAIMVVVLVYFIETPNPILKYTITSAVSINSTGTSVPQITTDFTTPSTTVITTSCRATQATVPIYNGDFGTGTFAGWNTTSTGFGTVPENASQLNANGSYYGSKWSGLTGEYFSSTYQSSFVLHPGNLTSDQFQVVEPYLNFKLISPQNAQLYMEILENNKPIIITHFNTYNSSNDQNATSHFVNASIPLSLLLCKNINIRMVAYVVGTLPTKTQYIAVSDFYQGSTPITTPGIVVNQTYNQ